VETTAARALELGCGVCQDFTHVMLAACRARGRPARYVSGYLHSPAGQDAAQATHAWVDVFVEGRGWISLDPTHGVPQSEHHVRVAVGRDYADVTPTRGLYTGSAAEALGVSVRVDAL
jgi:transglutaminase-like putative cysteine protease